MKIEKSIEIGKSSKEVFDYLKYTRNQDNFSVWNMADPSMKKEYKGKDGTVGHVYAWDSTNKNVGAGEQEIIVIDDGKKIGYELRFIRPMRNVGKSYFLIDEKGDKSSSVVWTFDSPTKFPYSLLAPVFKRIMGNDLQKGLDKLKTILEKK